MRPRLLFITSFPITLLSVGLALFSYRYVVRVGPVPPNIVLNRYFHPWLPIHAVGAGTALLLGPFQLSGRMRRRWPRTHRWSGRVYIVCGFVGAITGVILAAGTSSGNVAGVGFATGSILWLCVTSKGWYEATQVHWKAHRAWMIRSFAFAFSAVPFRALLLILSRFGVRQVASEELASWLAWVVNVIAAEVYLRRHVTAVLDPAMSALAKAPGPAGTMAS